MSNIGKRVHFTLTPLTPIHIGSGETLNPMNYTVQNGTLYYLNEIGFMRYALREKLNEYRSVLQSHDYKRIARFINDTFKHPQHEMYHGCYTVSGKYESEFKRQLSLPANSQFVHEFIKTVNGHTPYIPGSSIKGAFRTAMLSMLLKGEHLYSYDKHFESRILNYSDANGKPDITRDPLKKLRIADIPFCLSELDVFEVENHKTTTAIPNREANQRFATRKQISYWGEMLQANQELKLNGSLDLVGSYTEILEIILKSINTYYQNVILLDKASIKDKNTPYYQELVQIEKLYKTLGPKQVILRVGFATGGMYKTASIINMMPDTVATTRNVVNGKPVGFCLLDFGE